MVVRSLFVTTLSLNLITASATAPVHFALAIFGRLGLYAPEVAASWFKLYGDRDPAGYFELMSA